MAMCLWWTHAANADPILSVNVQSVTATAGDTGDALDVTLTNSGDAVVTIGGFSFGIVTANTDITFTDATDATTAGPYIFQTDSLLGPDLAPFDFVPGQSLIGSDLADDSGITLSAGETLGLGHVLFDVAAGASPGIYAVTLESVESGATSLSDPNGNPINVDSLNGGTITIDAAVSVPEPATLLLFAVGLVALGVRRSLFGRHAPTPPRERNLYSSSRS
jgi:hypothetical protein